MCMSSVPSNPSVYWHTSADPACPHLTAWTSLKVSLHQSALLHHQITRETKVTTEEQICGSGFNTIED